MRKWPLVKEWPDVTDVGLRLGEKINTALKVVVTVEHPVEKLEWGEFEPPIQLTGTNIEEQIRKLKEGDGGDIITFGSPTLVQSLTNAGLVNEYHIVVHPVIVNEGKQYLLSSTIWIVWICSGTNHHVSPTSWAE